MEIEINTNSKLIALQIDVEEIPKISLKNLNCDIIALKFGENIKNSKDTLKSILPEIKQPLMICGTGKDDIDENLIPELIQILDRPAIISFATEKTYKTIVPVVIKGNHYLVLKTPIDINLAKELNILSMELGLPKDKIIMNTDIGGLGYGYEYGYSMMEKVKIEASKGDEYLDLPIISEAAIESLKTKEAKVAQDEKIRIKRAKMIELSAVAGAIAAGANIVMAHFVENIPVIREII